MSSNSYPKSKYQSHSRVCHNESNSYPKISIKVTVGYVTKSLTHTLR